MKVLYLSSCFLLTEKINHVAKTLYFSSQNTVDCYKSFCLVSKFWSPTQLFFPSWNICSIIPLVSITYLALVHNYNTIKWGNHCSSTPKNTVVYNSNPQCFFLFLFFFFANFYFFFRIFFSELLFFFNFPIFSFFCIYFFFCFFQNYFCLFCFLNIDLVKIFAL